MKFVWEMNEKNWEEFANAVEREAFNVAYMAGEYLGCCRVGDLCFDIRAWNGGEWVGWGFELFCGGVDTCYGYSSADALATGKYKDKYEVPEELLYPYDEVAYGEFPNAYATYTMLEFQKAAEEIFEEFIKKQSKIYNKADLIAKANEELHEW